MLVLFLTSNFLIFLSILSGEALLSRAPLAEVERVEDRWFVCFWAGLSLLLGSFLAFAAVLPLKLYAIGVFPLLLVILRKRAAALVRQIAGVATKTLVALFLVDLVICAYMALPYDYFDSFLYHLQIIDWFTAYGIAPGIPLLHRRLGLISSWYALASTFQAGPLAGRVGTLANTMLLCAGFGYSVAILARLRRGTMRMCDRFWLLFFAGVVCLLPNEIRSTSPDFPAAALIGGVAWLLLHLRSLRQQKQRSIHPAFAIVPSLLAAAAVTVKASAAIAVAVTLLLYLCQQRQGWKKAATWLLLPLFPMGALAAANFLTSGCLAFPARFSCVNVSWAVSRATAEGLTELIRSWAQWGGVAPDGGSTRWLDVWLRHEKVLAFLLSLNVLAVAGSAAKLFPRIRLNEAKAPAADPEGADVATRLAQLQERLARLELEMKLNKEETVFRRLIREPEMLACMLIGLLGLGFGLVQAPSLRFSAGYACVAPCLIISTLPLVAAGIATVSFAVIRSNQFPRLRWESSFGLSFNRADMLFVSLVVLCLALYALPSDRFRTAMLRVSFALMSVFSALAVFSIQPGEHARFTEASRWWLAPARIKPLGPHEIYEVDRYGLRYFAPHNSNSYLSNTLCYSGNLPCTPDEANAHLRDPKKGLRAGYVR